MKQQATNQAPVSLEIGISLGSNSGGRFTNLCEARSRLDSIESMSIIASSPIYETEPVEVAQEHHNLWFLNAIVIASYSGDLATLNSACHAIEDDMGRARTTDKNSPRTIDIDLIYADKESVDSPDLILPHPRWSERRFVVQPLTDVRRDLTIPGTDKSVSAILASLPVTPVASLFEQQWE